MIIINPSLNQKHLFLPLADIYTLNAFCIHFKIFGHGLESAAVTAQYSTSPCPPGVFDHPRRPVRRKFGISIP